jgi:hypothetical protein
MLAYDNLLPLFLKQDFHELIKFAIVSDWRKLRFLGLQFLKNLTEFDIDLILDYDDIIKSSPHYKSRLFILYDKLNFP